MLVLIVAGMRVVSCAFSCDWSRYATLLGAIIVPMLGMFSIMAGELIGVFFSIEDNGKKLLGQFTQSEARRNQILGSGGTAAR